MTLETVAAIIAAAGSLLCTLIVGALAFFIKKTLSNLEDADKRNAQEIAQVRTDLAELKSDLPLIYTLREDFIRVINNVDAKLDKLIQSNIPARKE